LNSLKLAEPFEPLFRPKRYKVFFGGRGSGKSWSIATALLRLGASEKFRVLCTRELQGSIQDSVHKLLADTAERIGLGNYYDVQQRVIRGRNGTEFIFEGLRNNATKIKSYEGVKYVWCEEAEAISENSWDILIPTIRAPGSEIWVSFNPNDELDETYQRFVVPHISQVTEKGFYEDEDIYLAKVNWRENPWFPDELDKERQKMEHEQPRKYSHIWEGECNADYADSIIQPEWVDAAIDAHLRIGFKAQGIQSMGFDPADEGSDAKATATRHGSVITSLDQWLDGDITDGIDKAFNQADEQRCDSLVYDGIGIGAAVKVKLRGLSPTKISYDSYIGSSSPDDPTSLYEDDRPNEDVFRNKRAQYWWYLRDRFEKTYRAIAKNQYIDPNDLISISSGCHYIKTLKAELCRVQRKRGEKTYIQIESKQDMKKREIPSPNLADALVMSFANSPIYSNQYVDQRYKRQQRRSGWMSR